jgi:DNA-binding MarR family transcriptional regulator
MDKDVLEIQKLFPQIYVACHTEHDQGPSAAAGISWKDATLLAHLSDTGLTSPSELADHLNVTRATLSEALGRLVELDLVSAEIDPDDERRKRLRLTTKGTRALSQSSVLDYGRLERSLGRVSKEERLKIIEGLSLLAKATHHR